MIATRYLRNNLDVNLSSTYSRPLVPGVIFHILVPFFELPLPLKNKSAWNGDISIHL